jgi:hypothetical protein
MKRIIKWVKELAQAIFDAMYGPDSHSKTRYKP